MNIMFVAPMPMIPYRGGIQNVTSALARNLNKKGHNVSFLCRRDENLAEGESLEADQYHIPIDLNNKEASISKYKELLQSLRIDCVIFQWVDKPLELLLTNTPSYIKVISAIHQQPYHGRGYEKQMLSYLNASSLKQKIIKRLPIVYRCVNDYFQNRQLKLLTRYSDRVCLLSDKFIPRIKKINHSLDFSKFVGINNPSFIDLSLHDDSIQKENLILFVGRMSNFSKNLYTFIDVWKKVSEIYKDWKAVIVGGGEDLESTIQYADRHSVERIDFVGSRKNVDEYYRRAKIFCLTSFGEGFPMVLVESMAYGCVPCVFDTYESLHDIIDDEINGFISRPFDIQDMVSNISRLVNDEKLMITMSGNACRKVQDFDIDVITDKWINLINSIHKNND